ncbi:hypothetical protein KBX18_01655, partial [Corynebacterium sp. CCUG 69979]|uniref:hypothetical protein n=1 Tax=Corynebacterium sp. CCUG 69979 TaxID=2823890 RepID=UPI00210CDB9D
MTDWKYIFCRPCSSSSDVGAAVLDEPYGLSSNFRIASSRTGAWLLLVVCLCVGGFVLVGFWAFHGLFHCVLLKL